MPYQSDLVYDVGMHLAHDTDFYLAKGFRVIAIEAAPDLVAAAEERFREAIVSGQLTIVHAAVTDTEGPVTLYINPTKSEWNTIRADWSQRNARLGAPSATAVTVPGLTFPTIVATYGTPYYLKIDIEGADLLCIEGLQPPELPKYVSIESNKVDFDGLLHEFDVLTKLGYQKFKVVAQHKLPKQVPPKPAREGTYVSQRFSLYSSGLFGEEAPGEWMSADAAIDRYRRIFKRYEFRGDDGKLSRLPMGRLLMRFMHQAGWYDTHASL